MNNPSPLKPYPTWVCYDCAIAAEHVRMSTWQMSTWHEDRCDVCGEIKACTEPRDFGYPRFRGHEEPRS